MADAGDGDGDGGGGRRIAVVYYLSRNRHLEHPHFIEVPLPPASSPFLLRHFTARLNQLRGPGIAALYAWSCKRTYKTGFVWHDLSPDDPVLPANAHEYVLKGSQIRGSPPSPPPSPSPSPPAGKKHPSPSPPAGKKHPSPSPPAGKKHPSPPPSPPAGKKHPSPPGKKPSVDASTQTDQPVPRSRSISMDDTMLFHPQAPTTANRKSTSRNSETLESLIRAEGSKFHQLRVLEDDQELVFPTAGPRLSPATYLMHVISCGSISVKDYRRYGFIPIYRPAYVHVPLPSPMYATASTRFLTRMEDKEYFSGSIVDTKRQIDDIVADRVPVLKRSSSYNADRSCKSSDNWKDETEIDDSSGSRCLPRTMKLITSPLSDCPRSSSSGPDVSQTPPKGTRQITNKTSSAVEPSRRKKEKLFRIEERLTSGARVVIQSRVPCDENEDGADT